MRVQFAPNLIIEIDDISSVARQKIEDEGRPAYVLTILLNNGHTIEADIKDKKRVDELWRAMGGE